MNVRFFAPGLLGLLLATASALAAASDEADVIKLGKHEVHANRLLVRVKPGVSSLDQQATLQSAGLKVRRQFKLVSRAQVLELTAPDPKASVAQRAESLALRIEALRRSGRYEYVEPDYIYRLALQPNDSRFQDGTLWGLRNDGGSGGVAGADINAEQAWDITTGSTNVIVAVVDTGVRYTHQDLAAQMWRNPGESGSGKESNGIDDDNNGYVDDVFGINVVADNGNPMDTHGHGTHVSGTIGAAANNGAPHVGVAWNVRIMAIKIFQPFAGASAVVEGLEYAVANGAKISNHSWGGGGFSQTLYDGLAAARDAGHLIVAAAGNNGTDSDILPFYPAAYDLDNIVSVAALTRADRLANFSCYGLTTVDLGAPGVEIFSSTAGSDFEYQVYQGTSMAAPHVTGVAALMLARFPQASYLELRDGLLDSVVPISALSGKCVTGGRLNAYQALSAAPDNILEISVSPASGSVVLAPSIQPISVRVADRFGITNATVTAAVTNNGSFLTNLTFLNNGTAPDLTAGDAFYTANLAIPNSASNLVLSITATATGKTGVTAIVTYQAVAYPDNDNFAQAKKIAAGGGLILTTTKFATMEAGEPLHAGVSTVAHSLWYTWSTAASGPVLLDTAGSSFDTVIGVYTGANLISLTPVAAVDDVGNRAQGYVSFNATAGVTYRIAVAGANAGELGPLRLRAELNGRPDTNAPLVGISSPTNGIVTTTNFLMLTGTAYDPVPNASGVSEVLVTLNNSIGQIAYGTTNWNWNLVLVPGENLIQVSARDYSGNWATPVAIAVVYNPLQPANDHFVNALTLNLATNRVFVDTTSATKEYGEPNHAANQGGKSVWWNFTPAADGLVTLSTSNSAFDTLLGVYQGPYVNELTTVASNDDAAGNSFSALAQAVRAGQTYRVAVDGYAAVGGALQLNYSFTTSAVYSLNVTTVASGSASPLAGDFASNATVTVVASPAPGFDFAGWSGSIASNANPLIFNIQSDVTLVPSFLPHILTDGFESGGFSPLRAWNVVGSYPWVVQSNTAATGQWAARSAANLPNNASSTISLTAYTAAGNGTFSLRVSSEENWDFLKFYVDGELREDWSGELDWVSYSFPLTAGTHTLEWRYVKDVEGTAGMDAAFIDNVDLPTMPPSFKLVETGPGVFSVEVSGAPNQLFYIQGSTNLVDWETISTNHWTGSPVPFADPSVASRPWRFYRAFGPR